MSTQDLFVAAAHTCLCAGKRPLSIPQSLDLAAQVSAVDLGLKPALLYDSNGACAEQVRQYLSSLQSLHLISKSLLTLDLNGNSLVVSPTAVRIHLEQVLHSSTVAGIDICHSLERPIITQQLRGELKSMTQSLLLLLEEFQQLEGAERLVNVAEKCKEWNLCTVFGLLLGYPVTYWFDQTKSFDNCLSMTPLMVTTASATWQTNSGSHSCCLYSFSIPAALHRETQSNLETWELQLRERFGQQLSLKDLAISQSTVTLPSVCL
ncbi:UPF0739 protein C1orf74 homolog [Pholidichthys leucotaenia]